MPRSPLFGRRVHIAGRVADDPSVATAQDVMAARELIEGLVGKLVAAGATFVVPVDAEKLRPGDNLPICFDWLVWKAIQLNLASRPQGAPDPLVVAVQHHKTEAQVPEGFHALWDGMRGTDRVQIENVSHWNMASKRMEAQARWGDILITVGGGEGVLFLANLYHDAGKPVVPLNLPVVHGDTGAMRLFALGLSSLHASRLFRAGSQSAHTWINRIQFTPRVGVADRVSMVFALLEDLERPTAFAVRLLAPDHEEFRDVDAFFDIVVKPVIEGDLGYRLTVIDGRQAFEHARIDQEIFAKLHRSALVIADITGGRPNCFIEFGYALGRQLPTMVTAKANSSLPFDIKTFAGHLWEAQGNNDERRRLFREHWEVVKRRPPLVPVEPLIS